MTTAKMKEIYASMTLHDKVQLCHGCSSFEVGNIPRLDIGRIRMVDGPQGVRLEDGRKTCSFPCGMLLACTWDVEIAQLYGRILGEEARATGNHVLLGPGVNLMRTPLCGRNFEYYGEDPVLAGKIASGYIRGIQSKQVAATIKHLVGNEQEICRSSGNSIIDDRTLREIYLRPFELAVKEADPWCMMSAYNKVNGVFSSANQKIQVDIVRNEWNYQGVIMSDWNGAHDTMDCALGGMDLEMGQGQNSIMGEPFLDFISKGDIPESVAGEKAWRVLLLMNKTGLFSNDDMTAAYNTNKHQQHMKRLAQEGMVLLKNDQNFFPLDINNIKTLAVIGPNADFQHSMGPSQDCGGSGAAHPEYEVTPLQGLINILGKRVEIIHAPGIRFCEKRLIPPEVFVLEDGTPGILAQYYQSKIALEENQEILKSRIEENVRCSRTVWFAGMNDLDLPDHGFAVRWTGYIIPPNSGMCQLGIRTYDGSRVWIDEELLIDQWECRTTETTMVSVQMDKGTPVHIRVEFHDTGGDANVELLWEWAEVNSFASSIDAAKQADAVLFFGGTNHTYDREAQGWGNLPDADIPDLELIGAQAQLIKALAEVNPAIGVVLINGSVVSTRKWIDQVPAILETWYSGMEAGNAIAEVLFGKAFPGGKLCCTFAKQLNDYACHANGSYPGERTGEDPFVEYQEGLFMGYRHFDRYEIEPEFPFGFGLSYTEFLFKNGAISVADPSIINPLVEIALSIENTGERTGSEVIQVYVGDLDCTVERPVRELKSFHKVLLQPNEKQSIHFQLSFRDFAFWCTGQNKWVVEPGTFRIEVGNSSRSHSFQMDIDLL